MRRSPINDLYRETQARYPHILSRRSLDLNEQAAILACLAEGFIKVGLPVGNEKLPRLSKADLTKLRWDHLERIAGKYGSRDELLRELRVARHKPDRQLCGALTKALTALESAEEDLQECRGVLEALRTSVDEAIASPAPRQRNATEMGTAVRRKALSGQRPDMKTSRWPKNSGHCRRTKATSKLTTDKKHKHTNKRKK